MSFITSLFGGLGTNNTNASNDEEALFQCANCGKCEDDDDVHLKKWNGCKMVKYCNATCQKQHRPRHKKECTKRAAELFDEALFQPHPPKEECSICILPILVNGDNRFWKSCCGKTICTGCIYASTKRIRPPCPYCRAPAPFRHDEEEIERMKKRMALNDPEAFHMMGCTYAVGGHGMQQDGPEAVQLLLKAIELGSVRAHNALGYMYEEGKVVAMDRKKAKYHYQLAAIGGSEESRLHLGHMEVLEGNMERGVNHWMLGAEAGDDDCMRMIKKGFFQTYCNNMVTKHQYERAIRAHDACRSEMRSDDRDKAYAVYEEISDAGAKTFGM